MIVAHLSDLHLGHRAYDRTEEGRNIRERDVALAFQRAVQQLVRLQPELVVFAGDVFDRPDPPPSALVALSRGLESLQAALPDTPVLMVAGARDTPRRPGDPGVLAALDTFPRVEVAIGTVRSVLVRDRSVHACLVPARAALKEPFPVPTPDARARWNVLVAHARFEEHADDGLGVDPEEWDYVALGHDHSERRVRENVSYSGALERVGPAPWSEAAEEKGFLTYDLETGARMFHPVPGRAVVALAPIRVPSRDPDALRRRVLEVTGEIPGGIDGKIVHLRIRGLGPRDLLALQDEPLADLRRRALHLSVDVEEGWDAHRNPLPDARARLRTRLEALGEEEREAFRARLEELWDEGRASPADAEGG